MEVRRDNRKRTKTRGLDRFVVRTHKEYAAGLLPQREYVRGDDGAPFTTSVRPRISRRFYARASLVVQAALRTRHSRTRSNIGQHASPIGLAPTRANKLTSILLFHAQGGTFSICR